MVDSSSRAIRRLRPYDYSSRSARDDVVAVAAESRIGADFAGEAASGAEYLAGRLRLATRISPTLANVPSARLRGFERAAKGLKDRDLTTLRRDAQNLEARTAKLRGASFISTLISAAIVVGVGLLMRLASARPCRRAGWFVMRAEPGSACGSLRHGDRAPRCRVAGPAGDLYAASESES
jgi:hypothetical protein